MDAPRCVVLSDIRGDYRLLVTLLTKITQVATLTEEGQWQWNAPNTTLICTGNFTDRFDRQGYNRIMKTTNQAIEDEIRIIRAFDELSKQSQGSVVVLMGDHELGNLFNWSSYAIYQMQKPDDEGDQEARSIFVNSYLKPFAMKHGLIARWGAVGGTVYFSHGGIDRDWLGQFLPTKRDFEVIQHVNQSWQRWLKQNNFPRLALFEEKQSLVLSHKMSETPSLWREQDRDDIIQVLGPDPNPKFVVSDRPIQLMKETTIDMYLRSPQCVKQHVTTILASRNDMAEDEIYYPNNAMADVFCVYDDSDRQPQALEFTLKMNNHNQALFLDCNILTLSEPDYANYLNGRPFGTCDAKEGGVAITGLTEAEADILAPLADPWTVMKLEKSHDHIDEAYLLLFNAKKTHVLMVMVSEQGWTLPGGSRQGNESAWTAMKHGFQQMIKRDLPDLRRDGKHFDFDQHIRIYVHSTYQQHIGLPRGEWIEYKQIFRYPIEYKFNNVICQMMKSKVIPFTGSFDEKCV